MGDFTLAAAKRESTCQTLGPATNKTACGAQGKGAGSALAPLKKKSSPSVWSILFQWFVVGECGQALLAQLLRTALNILTPLAMAQTPTWLVGMVFLGEAVCAVLSPFALDLILVRYPGTSLKRLLLMSVLLMGVSAAVALLFYMSVAGVLLCMAVMGSAHSMVEALVFKRVVDHVSGAENPAVLNASMSAFSLFYVLGFTLGALIAGVPNHGVVLEQQLTAAVLAGVMVVYSGVYHLLLHKGYIPSKPHGTRVTSS
jgi:MFS family permease